ncbi:hypothetical protein O5D80_005109 [Batrachochytrium dendrobatidis]|nr:hypothetical protein O5D80_005109 [Batrachochytrium dendrobatidis]
MARLPYMLICAIVLLQGVMAQSSNGLADPQQASTALSQLCTAPATKNLLSCSIRAACKSSLTSSSDPSCSDAVLLTTACKTDAAVASASGACSLVSASCPAGSESSISQCTPVKGLLPTLTLQQNIFNICTAMKMEGCGACPTPIDNSTVASCDVMGTYAQLCTVMPDMSNCKSMSAMCGQSPLPLALAAYCPNVASSQPGSPSTSAFDTTIPEMKMYLHTGITDYVLFKSFVPRTLNQYVGAVVVSIALSIVFFIISAFRKSRLIVHAAYRQTIAKSTFKFWDTKTELYQLENAILRTLEVFVGYMMMLIVMTFNVGLIIAVLAGVLIGSYVFDRSTATAENSNVCCV